MRGKVISGLIFGAQLGITPAYAGKSGYAETNRLHQRDHPRICGEKIIQFVFSEPLTGSPPHMRGKGSESMAKRKSMGITPAYAGKSFYRNGGRMGRWDHPRICGEKSTNVEKSGISVGSPPHMRGKSKEAQKNG